MLLAEIWNGSYRLISVVPEVSSALSKNITFPLLLLEDSCGRRGLRVFSEDTALGRDLTLGDVLCEEFECDFPADGLVVAMGKQRGPRVTCGLRLGAEIIYSLVSHAAPATTITAFDWAMRSLMPAWFGDNGEASHELSQEIELVMTEILGYPAERASLSFQQYLRLLDPGFACIMPQQNLATDLAKLTRAEAWQDCLRDGFVRAKRHSEVKL